MTKQRVAKQADRKTGFDDKAMAQGKALPVLDAAFFMLESVERMANIGPLILLKPPAGKHPRQFADKLMAQMLRQPVGEPFNLRYVAPTLSRLPRLPRLEPAKKIDLRQHCKRLTLPAPGTQQMLLDLVCRLHVKRLPHSRPLWAFYFIDGLEGGRVALYGKVHHGLIDGVSFIELLTKGMSTNPDTHAVARAPWQGSPGLVEAAQRPPTSLPELTKVMRHVLGGAAVVRSGALTLLGFAHVVFGQTLKTLRLAPGMPLPFLNTGAAFVAPPSVKRSFAYCTLPLAPIRALGKRHGVTVNDVLLTVVDMALNRYLKGSTSTLPRQALVADMPVALREEGDGKQGDGKQGGNKIAVLQIPLGASSDTPAQRLAEIHAHVGELKAQVHEESAGALMLYTTVVHTLPALAERFGVKGLPPLANVVISNPFGVPHKAYLAGAEVEAALPVSVLVPGQSLNVTAVTYDSKLQIAFLGMAAHMPDIQTLADFTVTAFAELRKSMAAMR